ncbi:phenylacetate--CoA ligase family protein (plasmid) [Citricoccus sp. SGAir0253]|uniref:phenylacetate--CoA ligase family protein n=1 Tax=Citricoccus sp. SGAir0253 TaxID=2567881 RepID=UPI0010CD0FEC|nr:phenylacetate--CoA ligase family protein [Citricoccus sp. SGAir0253]QCU79722.1 phenylacetate--CoA ligase family protein [Citricoccus sp. SGAir0253]
MDLRLLANVLWRRRAWRRRDRWAPDRIAAEQAAALDRLRRVAYARSGFYRAHHAGLLGAPLAELPPVTKAQLMEHFDDVVTVPGLGRHDLEAHLAELVRSGADPGVPWRGRWWAAATAGTTGRPGVFVWDRAEWATVLASYARANDWAGIPAGLTRPLRVAVVSSKVPTHQSAVVGASLQSRVVPTLRLDATDDLAEAVARLNAFGPRLLVGYPSALLPLAGEQRDGRLSIAPASVVSASEVLTAHAAARLRAAWGREPFDVYAATETAGIASPCRYRTRHVYEDLVIVEPVDEAGAPVPPGTVGARLWVTVLFSRTVPLIRYEMSDRIALGPGGCPCGRSFVRLASVEGRQEDVLELPGATGRVRVHPNVFHAVLDDASRDGWQVVQRPGGLLVRLVGLAPGRTAGQVRTAVGAALITAGAPGVPVQAEVVGRLQRTALGKAPLVVSIDRDRAGGP